MWSYWGKIARFWAVDQLCGICSELRSCKKVGALVEFNTSGGPGQQYQVPKVTCYNNSHWYTQVRSIGKQRWFSRKKEATCSLDINFQSPKTTCRTKQHNCCCCRCNEIDVHFKCACAASASCFLRKCSHITLPTGVCYFECEQLCCHVHH